MFKINKIVLSLTVVAFLNASPLSFGMQNKKNIFEAIETNDLDRVRELVRDSTFDVNESYKFGMDEGCTPLYFACYNGYTEIVKELLKRKDIDVYKCGKYCRPPLFCAIYRGCTEIVNILLERYNIYVNKVFKVFDEDRTPFDYACGSGRKETVRLFLGKGLDKNQVIKDGKYKGWTLLHVACSDGNIKVVEELLELGADVGAVIIDGEKKGWTPLHIVCEKWYTEIVELLIAKGAGVNEVIEEDCEKNGWAPIHIACENTYTDIVESLLSKGADIRQVVKYGYFRKGWTPLHIACGKCCAKVIKKLLEEGADVNEVVEDGKYKGSTPLHVACQRIDDFVLEEDREATVQLLIGKGADINQDDKSGRTYASDGLDGLCHTPIHFACRNCYKEIVKVLLENGVSIDNQSIEFAGISQDTKRIMQLVLEFDRQPQVNKLNFIFGNYDNDLEFLVRCNFGRLTKIINKFGFVYPRSILTDRFYLSNQELGKMGVQGSIFSELFKNPVIKIKLKDIFELKSSDCYSEKLSIEEFIFEAAKKGGFFLNENCKILKAINLLKNQKGLKKYKDTRVMFEEQE